VGVEEIQWITADKFLRRPASRAAFGIAQTAREAKGVSPVRRISEHIVVRSGRV